MNIKIQKRIKNYPLFEGLADNVISAFCKFAQLIEFEKDSIFICDQEKCDFVFFILKGEVKLEKKFSSFTLRAPAMLGGKALATKNRTWISEHDYICLANVVAIKIPLQLFYRSLGHFYQGLRNFFELCKIYTDIKLNRLFHFLSFDDFKSMSIYCEKTFLKPGEYLFREGDVSDSCYFIIEGKVEVEINIEGVEKKSIARLATPQIIGEIGLISHDKKRTASIKGFKKKVILYKIYKNAFLKILEKNAPTSNELAKLTHNRVRPRRNLKIKVKKISTNSYILHNPKNNAFFSLSKQGYSLWREMDGRKTIQDLVLISLTKHEFFSPAGISEFIYNLRQKRFIHQLTAEKTKSDGGLRGLITFILRHRDNFWSIKNPDLFAKKLYRWMNKIVFNRLFYSLLAVVSLLGPWMLLFFNNKLVQSLSANPVYPQIFFLLIPLMLISIFLHEVAHILVVKRYQFPLSATGVGIWYWIFPIFYADTSHLWLANRKQRMHVALAGSINDAFIAGLLLTIICSFSLSSQLAALLLIWAFLLYAGIIKNICPLIETDGYYYLIALIDAPNIKIDSVKWLLGVLRLTPGSFSKVHLKFIIYWTVGFIYIFSLPFVAYYIQSYVVFLLTGSSYKVGYSYFSLIIPLSVFLISFLYIYFYAYFEIKKIAKMRGN